MVKEKTVKCCIHIGDGDVRADLSEYASGMLDMGRMQYCMKIPHHGSVTVYQHCYSVAYMSLLICRRLKISVDEESLVKGALLHDYYLYDWHVNEAWHRFHGFRHPGIALKNAKADFELTPIEEDIIRKHMFPLTPFVPMYMESVIVCIADKIVSVIELI